MGGAGGERGKLPAGLGVQEAGGRAWGGDSCLWVQVGHRGEHTLPPLPPDTRKARATPGRHAPGLS